MKKLFISIIFFLSINSYSQTVRPVSNLNKDASGVSLSGLPNYFPTWNNAGTGLTPKSYLYAQSNRNVCLNCESTLYEGFFGGAGLTINDSTGSGNHVTLEGTFGGNDYHWSWAMSTLSGQPYFGLWNGLGGNFMAFTDYQFGNPRVRIGGGAFYANAGVVEIFELDTNNTSLPLRITSKGNPGWMISSADTSNCNKCDWSFGINRDDDFKFSINNKLNTLTDNRTLSIDTTGKVVINNRLQIDNPISLSNAIGNDVLPKVKNDSLYSGINTGWKLTGNTSTGSAILGSIDNSNINISSGTGILNLNNTLSSSGDINIGNASNTQNINIGISGSGNKTINIGTPASVSPVNIFSGAQGINLNTTVGEPVNIGTGNNTQTIQIGNSSLASKNILIGSTGANSITSLKAGTGGGIELVGIQTVTGADDTAANTAANTTSTGKLYLWDTGGSIRVMVKK